MTSNKTVVGLTLFSVIAFSSLSGCSKRMSDFTIVSSKQMNMRVKPAGKGKRVEGKDGVYWLLTIPLGTPNLKEAVDRAIEKAGPGYDALIDGVMYTQNFWYFLTGYSGYKIIGTPVKTSELLAELQRDGKDVELAMQRVLFHSSLGISNEDSIKNISIVKVDDLSNLDTTPVDGELGR